MRLIVGCIGRLKSGPEADLAARYKKRLAQTSRSLGLSGPDVIELPEGKSDISDQRRVDEADRLTAKLPTACKIIVFDERGTSYSSREFAKLVSGYAEDGASNLAVLIGGADGIDQSLRNRADQIVSFGRLTLPHQIVRILVMEQLYRATTILTNHPYHRE